MKLIDLLNKIVNGEIKEGTQLKDNIGDIFIFKNNRFVDKNDNFYIYAVVVDDEVLNDEVEIIEEKQQQGRWEPKEEGTAYFSINDWGVIFQTHYNNSPQDWYRILNKNVFKTDSEAKEYLEYKTALLEAEKPFEEGKNNWKIIFNTTSKGLYIQENFEIMIQGAIYLGQDVTVAQAFVDKWHKQILKYEFDIEE